MKNVNYLLEDAELVLQELGIPYGPIYQVQIGTSTAWWGRCKYNRRYNNFTITINSALLDDSILWEKAMSTMIHELLHAHKDRLCHTGEWKRLAGVINLAYPEFKIQRCTPSNELGIDTVPKAKYKVICDKCKTEHLYARKGSALKAILKYPKHSGCHCGKCGGGRFTVITL